MIDSKKCCEAPLGHILALYSQDYEDPGIA